VLDGVGDDSVLVSVGRVNVSVGVELVVFQLGVLDGTGGP
jgi:hypothetical protein